MIPRCAPTRAAAPGWHRVALAALAVIAAAPRFAAAGEGGTTHVLPGANATLVDMASTTPGWFVKPMLMNYGGDATARIPTGAGVTSNLDVDATTFVLGGGYTFAQTVLGGAHYTVAVFQPYTWLDISGLVDLPGGGAVQRNNKVSGFGDMTIVPVLLGWKAGDWQFDGPVVMLVGGYDKGVGFEPLGRELARRAKAVICYGATGPKIADAIRRASRDASARSTEVIEADGFEAAVRAARSAARAGDVVLLSPGCASYDMFANYEQRGQQFRQFVESWG